MLSKVGRFFVELGWPIGIGVAGRLSRWVCCCSLSRIRRAKSLSGNGRAKPGRTAPSTLGRFSFE